MSLDWSAKKAPNWDRIGDPEREKALIFGTMIFGINPITEANYEEFFRRSVMTARAQGYDPYLTLEDCRNAIGLGTNASPLSPTAFGKKLVGALSDRADDALRRAKREEAEAAKPAEN